ncbi:MAG TPA: ABC transporter substrate-binding protein [Acidimicrobiales bacterium]|nr:ABC transporter substrate-binding protein [Acidimicrobiales bacterium]
MRRRWGTIVVLWAALVAAAAGCTSGDGLSGDGRRQMSLPEGSSTTSAAGGVVSRRPKGGSVRVGVWGEPDPGAATLAGAGVRALVLPQLFVAGPDGRWTGSLVEPGSDRTAVDRRSATLSLRKGAQWSDGTPITAVDLRRSADGRFVAGIDEGAPGGPLTLRFTQPLPGWRRLWSGSESVPAPRAGVWGGPFVVAERTPGLEAVLRRNDRWYGGPVALLDEVRLVLVPDDTIARQLLAKGALDVVMPPPTTVRTRQLESLEGVEVEVASRTGWWVGLLLRADRLPRERRLALVATVDRDAFVGMLLQQEATVLEGFAGSGDRTWAGVKVGVPAGGVAPGAVKGPAIELTGQIEEPMTPLLQRAMQKRARSLGGILELRNAEADRVEPWVADGEYQAAIVMLVDGPVVCWTCRWGSADQALAAGADAGDAAAITALEAKLRDDALLLPLWRPTVVVAWRDGLHGPKANGYAVNAAWNAALWWKKPGS